MRWKIPALCGLCVLLLAGGTIVFFDHTSSTDCGPGNHVEEPSAPPDASNTVQFEALNKTQRAAFRDALQCNAKFGPASKWLNISRLYSWPIQDPFRANEYVRYNGSLYGIVLSRGEFYSSYGIATTAKTPPEDASVTAFEDLPSRIRDEMRQALTTGHYSAPPGKWEGIPDPLESGGYIRYRNQTYELSIAVGDGRVFVMTLDRVD